MWLGFFVLFRSLGLPGWLLSNLLAGMLSITIASSMVTRQKSGSVTNPLGQEHQQQQQQDDPIGCCRPCLTFLGRYTKKVFHRTYFLVFFGVSLFMLVMTAFATTDPEQRELGRTSSKAKMKNAQSAATHLRADVYNLAIIFILTVYSVLQSIHWQWLHRLVTTCQSTNENFETKRKKGEFSTFIFLFLIAYLSGINSSLQMATMEAAHLNSTDVECETFFFKGCEHGIDGEYTQSHSDEFLCNGRPVFRSPLIFSSGHTSKDKASFNEIFSLINPSDGFRVWYMKQSEVELDEDRVATERMTLNCDIQNTYPQTNANTGSNVIKPLGNIGGETRGSGCVNCDNFRSTSDWFCWSTDHENTAPISRAMEVTFESLGEGEAQRGPQRTSPLYEPTTTCGTDSSAASHK